MVMQTSNNSQGGGVLGQLGKALNTVVQQHAADATSYGIIRLPGGISNGIAQLVSCGFALYKKGDYAGKPYFRAAGVIISPETVATPDGVVRVKGQQTSIMEPVCDTRTQAGKVTTWQEHMANVLNHLRMLGGEDYTAGAVDGADVEKLARDLEELAPYFRFSTSTSEASKDPVTGRMRDARVWENWNGSKGLEDYDPHADGAAGNGMEDDSTGLVAEEEEPEPPQAPPVPVNRLLAARGTVLARPAPATQLARPAVPAAAPARPATPKVNGTVKPAAAVGRTRTPTAPPPPPAREEPPFDDGAALPDDGLDALAEDAENGGDDAQQALVDAATAAGIDEQVIRDAEPWAALVELIRQAGADASVQPADEEPAEGPAPPAKGEVCSYSPVDPRTRKRSTRPVECEVTAVDTARRTVQLKNLATPTVVYKTVPWTELSYE